MSNLRRAWRDPDRYDHRQHQCGCETYWSLMHEKSVALNRCDDHAPHDAGWQKMPARRRATAPAVVSESDTGAGEVG